MGPIRTPCRAKAARHTLPDDGVCQAVSRHRRRKSGSRLPPLKGEEVFWCKAAGSSRRTVTAASTWVSTFVAVTNQIGSMCLAHFRGRGLARPHTSLPFRRHISFITKNITCAISNNTQGRSRGRWRCAQRKMRRSLCTLFCWGWGCRSPSENLVPFGPEK